MNKKGKFFDITEPQNYVMKLIHPVQGDTGATLTLLPPTDEKYIERLTLIHLDKVKKASNNFKKNEDEELSPENVKDLIAQSDEEWLKIVGIGKKWEAKEVAALVDDWSDDFGEDFTREDLEELLSKPNYAWVLEAIKAKANDDSNFFLNKEKGSKKQ